MWKLLKFHLQRKSGIDWKHEETKSNKIWNQNIVRIYVKEASKQIKFNYLAIKDGIAVVENPVEQMHKIFRMSR